MTSRNLFKPDKRIIDVEKERSAFDALMFCRTDVEKASPKVTSKLILVECGNNVEGEFILRNFSKKNHK